MVTPILLYKWLCLALLKKKRTSFLKNKHYVKLWYVKRTFSYYDNLCTWDLCTWSWQACLFIYIKDFALPFQKGWLDLNWLTAIAPRHTYCLNFIMISGYFGWCWIFRQIYTTMFVVLLILLWEYLNKFEMSWMSIAYSNIT